MPDPQLVLKSPFLFYLGACAWDLSRDQASGLYAHDTRVLVRVRILLNGQSLETLALNIPGASEATTMYANPALDLSDGRILDAHTVSIEESVTLDQEMTVIWRVNSYCQEAMSLELTLELSADFRDVFEIRGFPRRNQGTLLPAALHANAANLRYRGSDGRLMETHVAFDASPDSLVPLETGVEARFRIDLQPGGEWSLRLGITPPEGAANVAWTVSPGSDPPVALVTDNPLVNRLLDRSLADLDALISHFPHGTLPAAGIPWYVAPFGRDSLITGLQTLHLFPARAMETLRVLADLQGRKVDPFTEEEPGKILHEMRYGEMARLGEIPHRPYFGTVDATPLFVWLFAEVVNWTGDEAFYRELLPATLAAIAWIGAYGDSDGDGMVDYDGRDVEGIRIRHRVWKDSLDSLHRPNGEQPQGTITPVEVQGYVYAAYRMLSEVASVCGDASLGYELAGKAADLKERFERKFWVEQDQFYAQALADGIPVRSISSNPGHLLMTGLVSDQRSRQVIQRLTAPDMDSGWGIRTLAAQAISYNPMSYHNGSVWPHDNSLIAAGCHHVVEREAGNAIFSEMVDLALASDGERLNELYCGFERTEEGGNERPVPYPTACSPQAWAAGTLPLLVRSSLGLRASLSERTLEVDPCLPPFCDALTINNLTVFGSTGNLMVSRTGGAYAIEGIGLPVRMRRT